MAEILGAGNKPIAEVGAWLITDVARIRAAGLVSAEGDTGFLLQLGSAGTGRLNFNADVRRVWSRNGEPLIPLPTYIDNFGSIPPLGAQGLNGSYTQAIGSLTYSLGGAFMSLTGSYRRDEGEKADYSIGPGITWPVYNRGGIQFILNADAQRSRTTTAAFAGVRLIYTSGDASLVATSGVASLDNRNGGPSRSRAVGSLSAQYFHEDKDRTQVTLEGAVQRDVEATTALANAQVASRLGTVRADVLHGFEGRGGTQYGLNFQTGIAFGSSTLELGGRDLNQSAVIVSLKGSAANTPFDILIDGIARARVGANSSVPIFLEAYRSYELRVRPADAVPLAYDSGAKTFTLYPGTVEKLSFEAQALVTVFGQAVRADGTPIANAPIALPGGIGQTDDRGYFEVDAAPGFVLNVNGSGDGCRIPLPDTLKQGDFVRLGKVTCQ